MLIAAQDLDLDWYVDNIVVPGGPERAFVGRARRRQASWQLAARAARVDPPPRRAAVDLARRQGLVLTHKQARSVGLSTADLRRLVRRGTWTAPRRGVLCVLARPSRADDAEQAHGLRLEIRTAAAALVRPGTKASHESAAAMHGLPLIDDPSRPVLTTGTEQATCGRPDVRVHVAAIAPDEVTDWFGTPVLTVSRTVIDVARNSGDGAGLVLADAALREKLVTTHDLDHALQRAAHWPGVSVARRVVQLAEPLAESPLESLTRLLVANAGLPVPTLQVWVPARGRRYRVDGLWRERGVILECDGMVKYKNSADHDNALAKEKRRQEALEQAGYRVVRVTWAEVIGQPARTLARIEAALRLGGRTSGSA